MTVHSGFFNSVGSDRLYDADDMSNLFAGIFNDGVYPGQGNEFAVVIDTGMNVDVGSGRSWFNSRWTYNDSDLQLTVSNGHATYPRIDIVTLEINESLATRACSIFITAGTPASTPVPPTLTQTTEIHQYPLAHIYVAAGATSLSQGNITQKVGTVDCPYVTTALGLAANGVTNGDSHDHNGGDGAQINHTTLSNIGTNTHTQIDTAVANSATHIGQSAPHSGHALLANGVTGGDSHNHDGGDGAQIPTNGIATSAVTDSKIAAGAVSNSKIVDGAVGESKIGTGAVTETKIGTGAVTETKIGTGAVTNTKLATNAVTNLKIADGAVTLTKLASNSVNGDKLTDLSVTNGKIGSFAVTGHKIGYAGLSMFYRQGGDSNIWGTYGTNVYGVMLATELVGSARWTGSGSQGSLVVTFPATFPPGQVPLIYVEPNWGSNSHYFLHHVGNVSNTGFTIYFRTYGGESITEFYFNWRALGGNDGGGGIF